MKDRFTDRPAVVTGAASGIGLAIASRLLDEGALVLAVDKNPDALAAALPKSDRLRTLVADTTDPGAPDAIVGACLEAFGALRILVNNAGLGNAPLFHETTDDDYDKWLTVNLTGSFRLIRRALDPLLASKGVVLNIASTLGLQGYRRQAAYHTAKAGLIGLTRNLCADYGPAGVRFNCVAPGIVATPQTAARLNTGRFYATIVGTTPMGRPGLPEEIAGAAAFLCSDDAGFVNGQVLAVDGGQTSTVFVSDAMVQCWIDAHPDPQ
jgi:meso-butanediol dehydrogenase/(S,S)-butanediol dehydrogenase/diacetyl reductase